MESPLVSIRNLHIGFRKGQRIDEVVHHHNALAVSEAVWGGEQPHGHRLAETAEADGGGGSLWQMAADCATPVLATGVPRG